MLVRTRTRIDVDASSGLPSVYANIITDIRGTLNLRDDPGHGLISVYECYAGSRASRVTLLVTSDFESAISTNTSTSGLKSGQSARLDGVNEAAWTSSRFILAVGIAAISESRCVTGVGTLLKLDGWEDERTSPVRLSGIPCLGYADSCNKGLPISRATSPTEEWTNRSQFKVFVTKASEPGSQRREDLHGGEKPPHPGQNASDRTFSSDRSGSV